MSAWMISDDHADFLVTAFLQLVDDKADAQKLGRDLLHENMRSLSARYGEQVDWEALEAYQFRAWPGELDAGWINKNARCADYQCCEHNEWRDSDSAKWVEALTILTGGENRPMRDDAPWGIDPEHRVQAALLAQGVDKRPAPVEPDWDDWNNPGSRHHY